MGDQREASKIFESLRVLRSLKAKNWAILYLCLFRHISVDGGSASRIPVSLKNKWEIFSKFTFCYYLVLGKGGNWYFKTVWTFCQKIEELVKTGADRTAFDARFNELLKAFNSELPLGHEDFVQGFMAIRYKLDVNARVVIRYVLSEIESSMGDKYDVGFDESLVNIEHILPQTPTGWNLKKSQIKEHVNKIGNLLLISSAGNGAIGNKPLDEKIDLLKKVPLRTVSDFIGKVESGVWKFGRISSDKDFSAIDDRARDLAAQAYQIWVVQLRRKMGF